MKFLFIVFISLFFFLIQHTLSHNNNNNILDINTPQSFILHNYWIFNHKKNDLIDTDLNTVIKNLKKKVYNTIQKENNDPDKKNTLYKFLEIVFITLGVFIYSVMFYNMIFWLFCSCL